MSPQLSFAAVADEHKQYMRALDRMMVALAPQNAFASATVRKEYSAYLDLLVLTKRDALETALYTGGLVPLPEPERFNLRVRTDGPAPIAEKDLAHQQTYIAARAATVGALLDIASRVKSGPLEITSLVRHTEYQHALRATNTNANTSVPMHTMGLAVDIALVNMPLRAVYEIRDVLLEMQKAGDILVIGERKQLVFHVVPHPSRLGYYGDVYARAMAEGVVESPAIAVKPTSRALSPLAQPVVSAEVVGFRPTDDFADEWWAADGAHSDLTVAVTSAAVVTSASVAAARASGISRDGRSFFGRFAARVAAAFSTVVHAARHVF